LAGSVFVLAVFASSVLLLLALPPAGLHLLAWVALVPALAAVRGKGFVRGFGAGWAVLGLTALLARSGIFYRPSLLDGNPGWNYGGFALFGVAVGLTFGVWAQARRTSVFLLGAWSVVFEALLLLVVPGHLALTQSRVPAMLALASATGIWGVSYLVWLSNLAFAEALSKGRLSRLVAPAAALAVCLLLAPIWWRPEPGDMRVAAVQTVSRDPAVLRMLNREAGELGARLVVWPEESANRYAPAGDTRELLALARSSPSFVAEFEDGHHPKPYNCASLFTLAGECERYAKRHPFTSERSVHTPGVRSVTTNFNGHRLGLAICFDSCFPLTMREAAQSADLIAIPTNDPIAPYATVQALHASYIPFRAAETGVPMIRADVSAYSQIVDGHGFVLAEAPPGEQVLLGSLRPTRHWTLYRQWGDWFLYLCLFVGVLGAQPYRRRICSLFGTRQVRQM
jgi:apolipoprotein N-acyltransferase